MRGGVDVIGYRPVSVMLIPPHARILWCFFEQSETGSHEGQSDVNYCAENVVSLQEWHSK